MEFRTRKVPSDQAKEFIVKEVTELKPDALLFVPAYILLPKNGKLLSVKEPLDSFSKGELEHLSILKRIYLHPYDRHLEIFRTCARELKNILNLNPKARLQAVMEGPFHYELLSSVFDRVEACVEECHGLEILGCAVLCEEMFGAVDISAYQEAREKDADVFEEALLVCSFFSFLMILLGHLNVETVKEYRRKAFESIMKNECSLLSPSEERSAFLYAKKLVIEHRKLRFSVRDLDLDQSLPVEKMKSAFSRMTGMMSVENNQTEESVIGSF